MKHYVKRCLTALLAVALAFTMFPSSMARASEGKALQEAAQAAGEGSEQEAPQAVDAMGLLRFPLRPSQPVQTQTGAFMPPPMQISRMPIKSIILAH